MKDLTCWDCAMYSAHYGVRCAKHRSPREEEKLQAALGAELRNAHQFSKLR